MKVDLDKQLDETIDRWMFDPAAFVREAIGATPTHQQDDYLDALRLMVAAKLRLTDTPGYDQTYEKKTGISVMSGKGTGKDAALAWTIIWFLCLWPNAKMPVTGPSYDQVKDILWKEVAKWLYRRNSEGEFTCALHDLLEVKADRIYRKGETKGDDKAAAFARIRTAPVNADESTQAQTLGGWHEQNMIVVVDEASDVPDPTFTQFDTTMTQPMNFAVLAFNPTRVTGFAYKTHFSDERDRWVLLQWDSRDSELVTKEQTDRMEEKFGKDSPEYRIFTIGQPPEDDIRSLIPYGSCELAINRDLDTTDAPVVMGIDPARQGADTTAIVVRKGWVIRSDILELRGKNGPEVAEAAMEKIAELKCEEGLDVSAVYVDTIGYGASVYDALKKQFPRTYSVDVSKNPVNKKFGRLRDELWWRLADRFRNGTISIPKNAKLVSELSTIRLKDPDNQGRTKVENKVDLKRRGMPSPNIADALMITMGAPDRALQVAAGARRSEYQFNDGGGKSRDKTYKDDWMVR